MADEDSPPIVFEVDGATAILRFNRPARRNTLSLDTLQELSRITSDVFPRDEIHAVIFTGTEDVFASGANIYELAQLDPGAALEFSQRGQKLFQTIADARQVTIAAINGYCMGGGLDLALACDLRVASKSAVFSHPGARLGIITGWGGTQRLPRMIGRANALEFFIRGRRYSSDEALGVGLIGQVSDSVVADALKLAQRSQNRER